jgi:hypothetical protein
MSFNGSGSFLINTAGQPVVSGTVISSTAFNALTADLATGLSTCITKDGQTTVTANIPMSNFKFTGLGVGSGAADSANLSQVQSTVVKLLASVSGTDTITAVGSPTVAAYAAGQMFYFVAAGDNTGAVTINIDSLGAKAVTRDGSVALAAGDIKSGEVVVVVYDGTRFQVVSQLNSSGDARFANVSIASALNVGGVATFTGNPVLSGGTANGVLYLNASKVATSGTALVFDGTNLGVGVTPSAWGSIFRAVQVGTGGSIFGRSSGNQDVFQMGANVFWDGSNWKYIGNGASTRYEQATGTHVWSYAASGTAGNTITFTEAMALTSTGLGIGTSSPSAKLHVSTSATNTGGTGTEIARVANTRVNTGSSAAGLSFYTNEIGGTDQYVRAQIAAEYDDASNVNGRLIFATANTSGSLVARMRIDSSGNLGLGVTPSAWSTLKGIEVAGLGNAFSGYPADAGVYVSSNAYYGSGGWKYGYSSKASTLYSGEAGAHSWKIAASGTAGNTITFTQALTLDASGNLLVGATSGSNKLTVNGDAVLLANGDMKFADATNTHVSLITNSGAASTSQLEFWTGNPVAERARITAGGDVGIGTSSPESLLHLNKAVSGAAGPIIFLDNSASSALGNSAGIRFATDAGGTASGYAGYFECVNTNAGNGAADLTFGTWNGSSRGERARITSGGDFVVGKTSAAIGTAGGYITALGEAVFTVSGNPVLYVNRQADDGDLVRFYQADTQEGSISVSGNTVSYNAFAGSHWSQLQDGSKPDILRGTVMESINELCVWPDENNERLPKSKVSDTAGSKKVYGVFMAWDNDWTTTNDMYVTAVGAFICRVNGSVTVQEGDLLESNGDGTARVQADDIIRSSTIGKVTSTVKTHEYDDGSYCVPTVLYCG